MNAVSDPSTKKKQPSSKDAGKAKTKAFREGMQDNSAQEVNREVVTNTPRKIVNTQEEDVVLNKQDQNAG